MARARLRRGRVVAGSAEASRGSRLDKVLNTAAGQRFSNHLPLTFERLQGDPDHIENEGLSADIHLILHPLQHAVTTANRLGSHCGLDANVDLLAWHAAHT